MTEHPEHQRTEGRRIPVQRLQPGGHSCMDFTDVEARWEVLAAHTRTGLTRGEKVMIILDPSDLNDGDAVARLDGGAGQADAAWKSGQLELGRNTPFYLPDGRFDKERQIRGLVEEVERVRADGYPGLRAAADMTWASRAEVDDDVLVDYERSLEPLFEPLLADSRFATICWYDRRRFSDHLVATMRQVHPLQVMERLDALEVTSGSAGVRIAGAARSDTRDVFTDALRHGEEHRPLRFEIDLTDLVFMEAHCARQLIDFAAALPADHRVVVRCGLMHEMALQALGSDDVAQLELVVEDVEGAA
jgi:MEDS: MEthanogen/methylotroph, DcmR Sensory domain